MADEFDSDFESPSENGKGSLAEAAKRILTLGVSAAFVTEETLKHMLRDLKLPREVFQGLVNGASKSKQDMLNKIGGEVVKMLSKIDFVKEASRFVETHKFQITAEVNVIRKDDGEKELVVRTPSSDSQIEIK